MIKQELNFIDSFKKLKLCKNLTFINRAGHKNPALFGYILVTLASKWRLGYTLVTSNYAYF